jgi:hypothetical protein
MTVPALSSANVGPMGPEKTVGITQQFQKQTAQFKEVMDRYIQSPNTLEGFSDELLISLLAASRIFPNESSQPFSSLIKKIVLSKKGKELTDENATKVAAIFFRESLKHPEASEFDGELLAAYGQGVTAKYLSMLKTYLLKLVGEQHVDNKKQEQQETKSSQKSTFSGTTKKT